MLPRPGSTPRRVKLSPSTALRAAIRTSQPSVIVTPTPYAAPLIAAITGFG